MSDSTVAARSPVLPATLLVSGVVALGGTLAAGTSAAAAVPVSVLFILCALLAARPFVSWRTAVVGLILVILFIPIRRYTFPLNLPFQLEPYRVLVLLIVGGWLLSLLSDSHVRARKSGFELPIAWIAVATMGSVVLNPERVNALQSDVVKAVTFFASFVFVFYLLVSVTRTRAAIDLIMRVLVCGAAVIAFLAVIESRTGFNPFSNLDRYVPFLAPVPTQEALSRGLNVRATGPAEHPIALGAALMLLIPCAVYLAVTMRKVRWWLALAVIPLGALSTQSRTGVVMLLVIVVVYLVLRPKETRRQWPLALILVVGLHFAIPGTMGTLKATFFPEGGIVAAQEAGGHNGKYSCSDSGRIADLGPAFADFVQKPAFGYGYGTRITVGENRNACIFDDQWLSTLLDSGTLGVLGWAILLFTVIRRLGRSSRHDDSPAAWLEVSLAASLTAFAVGMFTFDAFGFIQFFFLFFILLGVSSAALTLRQRPQAI